MSKPDPDVSARQTDAELRLVLDVEGSRRRFRLRPGENLVGSGIDCDITVEHPTVSRNHAVVVVGDALQLADLGSTNGTFLDAERLRGVASLEPGRRFFVGQIEAWIETVEAAAVDLSPAVSLPGLADAGGAGVDPTLSAATGAERTTTSSHPLLLFSLKVVPELLDALRRGAGRATLAQLAGRGLFETLPVSRIEIECSGLRLFAATRDAESVSRSARDRRIASGGTSIVIEGARGRFLELAEPLLRALAGLLDADGSETPAVASSSAASERQEADAAPEPRSLDPTVRKLYRDAARIAPSEIPVLITGESGTGKEVFARFVHGRSGRETFRALNCAALPRDLLEAELFGIERGVATGVEARPGCFEQADGGTLFLDEIGDMGLEVQAKLLRVLETGRVVRLGGREARPARVRVLSATNKDLESLCEQDAFRLDLYYRLADWVVELPPLRERPADLPNLVSLFLERFAAERGVRPGGVSRRAMEAMLRHSWPGNVRELQREIRRAVLLVDDGEVLDLEQLSPRIRRDAAPSRSLEAHLAAAERLEIERALAASGGRVAAAAELLEVPQSTLYRKLKGYDLKADDR